MKEEMKKLFIECCNQIQTEETDKGDVEITNFDEILSKEFIDGLLKIADGAENLKKEIESETFKTEILNATQDNKMLQAKVKGYLAMVSDKLLEKLSAGQPEVLVQGGSNGTEGSQKPQDAPAETGSKVNTQEPSTELAIVGEPPRTQMQKTQLKSVKPDDDETKLAMNREDIVKCTNARLAKLISDAKTENQIDRIKESEAHVLVSLLTVANKNVKVLEEDNMHLRALIEKSNQCLDKIDTKKQTQFKKAENAINSRTHLTGMKIKVIEPVIPDNIDFADLDAMMDDLEEDFDIGYERLEAANSDYDQLFNYYQNGLKALCLKK